MLLPSGLLQSDGQLHNCKTFWAISEELKFKNVTEDQPLKKVLGRFSLSSPTCISKEAYTENCYKTRVKERVSEKSSNRFLTIGNKTDGYQRGGVGGWVKYTMGSKEHTCDGHWGMYRSVESLCWIPETNVTVC